VIDELNSHVYFCRNEKKMDMLMVTAEEKKKVREYYNVSEDQIKEDVERIKTWKDKQAHLSYDITGLQKVLYFN
jgi:hypothetical protein